MTDSIQKLRDAAKQVADATKNEFVFASVEIKHNGPVEFSIYRSGIHKADTLEEATAKAISFSKKDEILRRASALRKQADELEQEAA